MTIETHEFELDVALAAKDFEKVEHIIRESFAVRSDPFKCRLYNFPGFGTYTTTSVHLALHAKNLDGVLFLIDIARIYYGIGEKSYMDGLVSYRENKTSLKPKHKDGKDILKIASEMKAETSESLKRVNTGLESKFSDINELKEMEAKLETIIKKLKFYNKK